MFNSIQYIYLTNVAIDNFYNITNVGLVLLGSMSASGGYDTYDKATVAHLMRGFMMRRRRQRPRPTRLSVWTAFTGLTGSCNKTNSLRRSLRRRSKTLLMVYNTHIFNYQGKIKDTWAVGQNQNVWSSRFF